MNKLTKKILTIFCCAVAIIALIILIDVVGFYQVINGGANLSVALLILAILFWSFEYITNKIK